MGYGAAAGEVLQDDTAILNEPADAVGPGSDERERRRGLIGMCGRWGIPLAGGNRRREAVRERLAGSARGRSRALSRSGPGPPLSGARQHSRNCTTTSGKSI